MDPRLAILAQRILGMGNPPVASGATNFDPSGQRGAPMGPPAPQPDPRPFFPRSPAAPPPMAMPPQPNPQIASMAADFQPQGQPNLAPPPGQAQWQATVDAAKRRMGIGNMMNALGQLGTYVHTPQGVQKVAAVEGLGQGMIDQAQQDLDTMSPGERAYIKAQVPEANIPDGMTRTQFRAGPYGKLQYMDPRTEATLASRERTATARDQMSWDKFEQSEANKLERLNLSLDVREGNATKALMLRERSLDQGDRRLDYMERESGLREGRAEAKFKQPSEVAAREMRPLLEAKWLGQKFLDEYDPSNYGPVIGRFNNMLKRLGIEGEKYATDEAVRARVNASYLFGEGGKVLTANEIAYLSPTLPQLYQNPEAFRATLENLLSIIDTRLDSHLATLGGVGKNTAGLAEAAGRPNPSIENAPTINPSAPGAMPQAPAAAQSGGTGMVRMYDPKRKVWGSVPAAQVEAAKAKGLQTEEELNASR